MTNAHVTHDTEYKTASNSRLFMGIVTSAPEQTDNGLYHFDVASHRYPNGRRVRIHPSFHGDLRLPVEGAVVLVYDVMGDEAMFIHSYYHVNSPIPTIFPGERQFGQPTTDGNMHWGQMGEIRVESPTKIFDTSITKFKKVWDRSRFVLTTPRRRGRHISEHIKPGTSEVLTQSRVVTRPDGQCDIAGEDKKDNFLAESHHYPTGDYTVRGEDQDNNTHAQIDVDHDGHVLIQGNGSNADASIELKTDGTVVVTNDTGATAKVEPSGDVRLESDGGATIEAQSNGDVVINGGNTRPLTDISTTKDADGHVTSVSVDRANDVYVPQ